MTHDERIHYHMYETCEGIAEHAERIVALEELLRELWVSCPVHDTDCDVCKHKGGSSGCELYDRMRELGIEVYG